ncbi:peptidyl-prolyl cis-trans isomerase [Novymonas esmeraldas]|uniref:Peptidyl-prolyl cis-trans isomerase n=1 Tax=Novymonas esmeraldas TaxID=1808958 RepID=A0AAW0EUF6_9TRYP
MSGSFHSNVAKLTRAAETVSADADPSRGAMVIPLCEAAESLPPHIIAATDPVKLNKQAPIFRCPVWAGLPPRPFHLHCQRGATPCPALGLQRFPYYLFGKGPACDYVLEHPSISAVHAALVFHKEQACYVLLDLGSTNGVRLYGKRVEPRRPIPIAVGAVMQFGYSTRTYELRTGPPPSLKRLREDGSADASQPTAPVEKEQRGADPLASSASCGATAAAAAATSPAVSKERPAERTPAQANAAGAAPGDGVASPDVLASAAAPSASAVATTESAPVVATTDVVVPPAPIHLFQLVVKHKDVENPISRGHNKGERITRSRADALDLARCILADHARRVPADAALGFSPWTVEEFVAAVGDYCEVSAKKKRGDLGMVEQGTFADDIDDAAFRLRRGEVSVPIETQLGVHLLYRCD